MFRAADRSSSGALIVFAASGLHTHVVNGRSQVWVETGSSSGLHKHVVTGRSRVWVETGSVSGLHKHVVNGRSQVWVENGSASSHSDLTTAGHHMSM
jgi:hypothetical protein